ncbi:MAG: hypothetical protein GX804_04265 [Lentisphaerae bacterium]|nr:hypothetical protein [Lentisphaerota bacterium]
MSNITNNPALLNISGVLPHLAVKADHFPARTETGIGALMPWAGVLWFITYVAHKAGSGGGTGLFSIDDSFTIVKHPESVVGTYANRMIHRESNNLIIGPHKIDTDGNVSTFKDLTDVRLTATCRHLEDPANKVYFLGMEGEFFEADVRTMEVKFLADLIKELSVGGSTLPHFKSASTNHHRVVVANNSYYPEDFINPEGCGGRLAEWDGKTWKILERTQFNTTACRGGPNPNNLGPATFAVGQDRASTIFEVYLSDTGWKTYRLPKATHTQDHAWTTEWPRIREVESERWLMNAGGMFYELPAMTYADSVWGLRPISTHLRIIGDFCSWNGLLVLAGDQTTPINDTNLEGGQPQANLWFGKTDDLWQFGKPSGWGGPWWDSKVDADKPSDPYLMTGFDKKCLHINHDGGEGTGVKIQVDFMGHGRWSDYETLTVREGYAYHVFPEGFSAHWVRLIPVREGTATAQFFYT